MVMVMVIRCRPYGGLATLSISILKVFKAYFPARLKPIDLQQLRVDFNIEVIGIGQDLVKAGLVRILRAVTLRKRLFFGVGYCSIIDKRSTSHESDFLLINNCSEEVSNYYLFFHGNAFK